MIKTTLSADGRTLNVRIPMRFRRRGGRRIVVVPENTPPYATTPPRLDGTLLKALARAHRWQQMLETGKYATIGDLAAAEKINHSYLCRILRLTLLAPDIVEAIAEGRQPRELDLQIVSASLPVEWEAQRALFKAE